MIERAEKYLAHDSFTNAEFIIQFWDTHKEIRPSGQRIMKYVVWQNSPTWPSVWNRIYHNDIVPPADISCDGPEAARMALGECIDYRGYDDIDPSELEIESID